MEKLINVLAINFLYCAFLYKLSVKKQDGQNKKDSTLFRNLSIFSLVALLILSAINSTAYIGTISFTLISPLIILAALQRSILTATYAFLLCIFSFGEFFLGFEDSPYLRVTWGVFAVASPYLYLQRK